MRLRAKIGKGGATQFAHTRHALLIFTGFALLYLSTLSHNLSIAHDSAAYAADILLKPTLHPNHLFYKPILANLISLLQGLGVTPDPRTIEAVGALTGAGSLLAAFLVLVRRLEVPPAAAAAAVTGAGFSFGIWYYSVAVEISSYALCLLAWSLYLLLDSRRRPTMVLGAAALQSAAVLFHQSAILFSAVPVVVLLGDWGRPLRQRLGLLSSYTAVGTVIVGGSYLAVAHGSGHTGSAAEFWTWLLGYGARDHFWSPFGPKAMLLAALGLGRAVIGGHFVFAIPVVRDRIAALFPGNTLDDEVFLVRGYPEAAAEVMLGSSILWLAAATFCLVLALVGAMRLPCCASTKSVLPLIAWLVPYTVFFTAYGASNVDFWVVQVLLIWMLLAVGLVTRYPARRAAGVLAALAGSLLILNGLGSILPALDPGNDYYRAKVEILTEPMSPEGLIVLGDFFPDSQQIRVHAAPIEFVALTELHQTNVPVEDLAVELRQQLAAGRSVYLWPDISSPSRKTLTFYGPSYRRFLEAVKGRICGMSPLATWLELRAYQLECIR